MKINFKNIVNRLIKKENKIVLGANSVFLDFGNNTIKIANTEALFDCKSCARVVDDNYVIDQTNALRVDDIWYMIGETNVELNMCENKIDRSDFKQLLLYGLENLNRKSNSKFTTDEEGIINIDLYMLLPAKQLKDEFKFRDIIESKAFEVELNDCDIKKYRINLIRCFAEGSMVIHSFKDGLFKKNKVIIDIGGGTSDIFVIDANMNTTDKLPLDSGMRNLMARYSSVLGVDCNVVDDFLKDDYPFTNDKLKAKKEIDYTFLDMLMQGIYNSVLRNKNEFTTDIICVGGGSLALKDNIKSWIAEKTRFKTSNVKVQNEDVCIFSNVVGLRNYVNKTHEKQLRYYAKIKSEMNIEIEVKVNEMKNEQVNEVVCNATEYNKTVEEKEINTPSRTLKNNALQDTNVQKRLNKMNKLINMEKYIFEGKKSDEIFELINNENKVKIEKGTFNNYKTLIRKMNKYNEMKLMQLNESEILDKLKWKDKDLKFVKEYEEYKKAI